MAAWSRPWSTPGIREVLGCAVLGIQRGELMAALEAAMVGRVPYTTLREATSRTR